MIVKLLTENHLEFLSLKEAAEARLSLHLSKCHIVGNLMHWLIIHILFGYFVYHVKAQTHLSIYWSPITEEGRFHMSGLLFLTASGFVAVTKHRI